MTGVDAVPGGAEQCAEVVEVRGARLGQHGDQLRDADGGPLAVVPLGEVEHLLLAGEVVPEDAHGHADLGRDVTRAGRRASCGALLVLHAGATAALGLAVGLLALVTAGAALAARRPESWRAG